MLLLLIINYNVTKVSIIWTAPDRGLKCYKDAIYILI